MSTSTTTFETVDAPSSTRAAPRKGFWARFIEQRTRQGEASVRFQMSRMSNERLADLGFTAEQIAYIRTNGRIPGSFWR